MIGFLPSIMAETVALLAYATIGAAAGLAETVRHILRHRGHG